MKSFIESTIIILGAYGFIYGINKLFYRYSFFHSAPSIKTLSKGGIAWFFLSIIAFFGISMGLAFPGIGFDLLYERGLFVYLSVLMIVLVSVAIVVIFPILGRICSCAVRHKCNDILVQFYFLPFLSCSFFS